MAAELTPLDKAASSLRNTVTQLNLHNSEIAARTVTSLLEKLSTMAEQSDEIDDVRKAVDSLQRVAVAADKNVALDGLVAGSLNVPLISIVFNGVAPSSTAVIRRPKDAKELDVTDVVDVPAPREEDQHPQALPPVEVNTGDRFFTMDMPSWSDLMGAK